MKNTKDKALESLPKIGKEQAPSEEETSNQILYGDDNDKHENLLAFSHTSSSSYFKDAGRCTYHKRNG